MKGIRVRPEFVGTGARGVTPSETIIVRILLCGIGKEIEKGVEGWCVGIWSGWVEIGSPGTLANVRGRSDWLRDLQRVEWSHVCFGIHARNGGGNKMKKTSGIARGSWWGWGQFEGMGMVWERTGRICEIGGGGHLTYLTYGFWRGDVRC